jgi:hypothetical protein
MVVLYTTGVRFDTDKLVHELPLTDSIIKIEKQGVLRRGESKKDRIKHRKVVETTKRTTGFGHNSITLVLLSDGDGTLLKKEITVKIFQNGVFHITGVLDELYDRHAVNYLKDHIVNNCPTSVISGDWSNMSRRVVLMNYKTKMRGTDNISRETLHSNLRKFGFKTNYEPAVYPAVKIYFPDKKWIAKVFRTGQIILTGMTSAEECLELRQTLERVLISCAMPSQSIPMRA